MLNPASPIPLYHQLADLLIEQIRTKVFQPGEAIPSETFMAKDFGIGRPTVRQAIDVLVKKGLVERRRGSGTYVKPPAPKINLFSLAGTSQAFQTKGIETCTQIIEPIGLREVKNDPSHPFEKKKVFFLSRITRDDEGPILLEDIWLLPKLFPGLDRLDLKDRSLARIVSEHYYLEPVSGHQSFRIVFPDESGAAKLGIQNHTPVLEVSRTLDFENAQNAVFSRLYCLTDRFAFSQTIHR